MGVAGKPLKGLGDLLPLVGRDSAEELLDALLEGDGGLAEKVTTSVGDGNANPAAVAGVALPTDEAFSLEPVEDADDGGLAEMHLLGQPAARDGPHAGGGHEAMQLRAGDAVLGRKPA